MYQQYVRIFDRSKARMIIPVRYEMSSIRHRDSLSDNLEDRQRSVESYSNEPEIMTIIHFAVLHSEAARKVASQHTAAGRKLPIHLCNEGALTSGHRDTDGASGRFHR